MKPRPDYQRRQAHRQRLALGRALHQVCRMACLSRRGDRRARRLHVPRIVRKHAWLLRWTFLTHG